MKKIIKINNWKKLNLKVGQPKKERRNINKFILENKFISVIILIGILLLILQVWLIYSFINILIS